MMNPQPTISLVLRSAEKQTSSFNVEKSATAVGMNDRSASIQAPFLITLTVTM